MSNQQTKIGTRVFVIPGLNVGQHHGQRWGEIVAGPEVQFGVRRYQVRLELKGRETVQQTVWLPAKNLRVPKTNGSTK